MTRIFISYRRNPDYGFAYALYNLLIKDFGTKNVFMDTQTMDLGDVFPERILKEIAQCDVFLVLISEKTLDTRIHDPDDWVRREIQEAIHLSKVKQIRVIPVLLVDAVIPQINDLPIEIRPLLERQAKFLMKHSLDETYSQLVQQINRKTIQRKAIQYTIYTIFILSILGIVSVIWTASKSNLSFSLSHSATIETAYWLRDRPGTKFTIHFDDKSRKVFCKKTNIITQQEYPLEGINNDGDITFIMNYNPGTKISIFCGDYTDLETRGVIVAIGETIYFDIISSPIINMGGYEIDSALVTFAEFVQFWEQYDYDELPSYIDRPEEISKRDSTPYFAASWYEANAYCNWRYGSRLPTFDEILKAQHDTRFQKDETLFEWLDTSYSDIISKNFYSLFYTNNQAHINMENSSTLTKKIAFRCARSY